MFYFLGFVVAIVEDAIICMHGGLSPDLTDLNMVSLHINFFQNFNRIFMTLVEFILEGTTGQITPNFVNEPDV